MFNEHTRTARRPSWSEGIRAFLTTLLVALAVTLAAYGSPGDHSDHSGSDPKARTLMDKVATAVGTYADLRAKGDVQYSYVYRDNKMSKSDVSTERYLFDGELSWARYDVHEVFVFPGQSGSAVQSWDGKKAWTTIDGQGVDDPQALYLAKTLRLTNFYWFAMMQKLSDPGTGHHYKGTRDHKGVTYELVEMTFDAPEGTNSDTYLLYIHRDTHRVDRFLYTAVDFGVTEPSMMEVTKYQRFGKVVLPVTRRYAHALSWEGDVDPEEIWVDQEMTDIRFGNGFEPADFSAPR